MDRSSRKKINKDRAALKDTLDQMDLTGMSRALDTKAAEYISYSRAYGSLPKIGRTLHLKTSLKKCEKTDLQIKHVYNPNGRKLEINYRHKKPLKYTETYGYYITASKQ